MASDQDHDRPLKLYFRIGEVAEHLGVDTSVLRHWETEFRSLRPRRTTSGQRVYTQADLRRAEEIKRLLYEKGFTTKGAVKVMRDRGIEPRDSADPIAQENEHLRASLFEIRDQLIEFLAELDDKG
ncbi:MAG: MerR family transcriptional regulator [Polyangiaceae bacterium]|nr:MerR family transcriptional regulator [Polyangiaceae bacterium]